MITPHDTEVLYPDTDEEEIVNITRCEIEIVGDPLVYIPGNTYTVKVKSHKKLGHLINTDVGTFQGPLLGKVVGRDDCRFYSFRQSETVFTWDAPAMGSGDNTFHALCGAKDGPAVTGIWVADKVVLPEVESSITPSSSPTPSVTPSVAETPSMSPSSSPSPGHSASNNVQVSKFATALSVGGALVLAMIL